MADLWPPEIYFFVTFMTLVPHVHPLVAPKTPVLSGFEPAAIGSYRELVCDAGQPGAGTITHKWYKYSKDWESKGPIATSQKYIFNPVTEKYLFHKDSHSKPESVSGKYKCRASNSAGTTRDSEWGDLYVYKPCSLYTVSISPSKPAVGSTFTLNCYIPNPSGDNVTWTKRSDALSSANEVATANSLRCRTPTNTRYNWSSCSRPSSTSKTFNLQITNARTSDSGYWFCQDIGLSCTSNPMKTVVQAPPGKPQITGFPSGPVLVGAELNLKCVASPPGETYDWYKDNTKVSTSSSYDFQVKKESAGVYKCVARTGARSATSGDKTLTVYYKPDSVVVSSGKTSSYVGEKDKFTCTATGGNPTPTLKVYFKRSGGTPVEVTQGQERVMTKEDNQAEYYCEATVPGYSSLTMRSDTETYSVTFPNTKVFFTNDPTAAVQVGQVKTFRCETDESNPIISTIWWWIYNGSSWQDITTGVSPSERNGTYGKIRISDVAITATKAMNGATVRCTSNYGENRFISRADTTMNVKYKPDSVVVSSGKTSSHVGEKDKFTCTATGGNPTPTLKIYFKRSGGTPVEVTQGQERVMDKEDNQVEYYCEATTSAWTMRSSTKTYSVTFPPDGIQLSQSVTVREGESKTIMCRTASSSNPAVSVSVKKKLGSTDVDVTGSPSVTNGANSGKDVSVDIKLDTNRRDNGAQYNCTFTYGSSLAFTKTAKVNVLFAPNTTLTYVKRHGTKITARWRPLHHSNWVLRIKYCSIDNLDICGDHLVMNQTAGETSFVIEGSTMVKSVLGVYLEVFDGPDLVFRSKPVTESREVGTNVGMIAGVTVTVILVIVAVVATIFILRRRNMACFSGPRRGQSGPVENQMATMRRYTYMTT